MIVCKRVITLLIYFALYAPLCDQPLAMQEIRSEPSAGSSAEQDRTGKKEVEGNQDTSEKAEKDSSGGLFGRWGRGKGDFLRQGFAPMLEKAIQSVVTVLVSAERPLGQNLDTLSDGELHWILESGAYPKPSVQKINASGTGFVVKAPNAQGKESLLVITNHHVVEPVVAGSGVIHVAFQSGETIPATIIAVDARTDLAVLSIEPKKKIPALRWGKSKKLRVGNWVLAVGAPGSSGGGHNPSLMLDFSVTHGIVSNINRVVPELAATHITSFIQTDAALNPGNSGGPLLNVDGEVVGVNTMIISSTGGSNGISLAIPSDLAMPVIAQLAKGNSVQRGYIGIQIGDDVSVNWAKHLGMSGPRGVLIDSVLPNTPGEKAGLKDNDVILTINETPIFNHQQARALIGVVQPGKILNMRVWRVGQDPVTKQAGREVDFKFIVGQLPLDAASKKTGNQVFKCKAFGVSFRHIGPEAMARMRMFLKNGLCGGCGYGMEQHPCRGGHFPRGCYFEHQ